MPRIADPSVTNIGALQANDSIPVDRIGINISSKTTPAAIAAYIDAPGKTAEAVTAHEDTTDPHPQYLTTTEGNSLYAAALGADDNYVTNTEKTSLHSHGNKAALDTVSGINTGDQDLTGLVPKTTTINSKALTGNITLSAADVGADPAGSATAAVAAILDAVPATLDTLNELAAALGDDPNFAATTAEQIGGKIDKSLATSASQFLFSSGVGAWVVKTVAELKSILGLGDAAYKNTGTTTGTLAAGDDSRIVGAQATLVSGTNIKTINGETILGTGDVTVSGMTNPMTASGDIVVGGTGGTPGRLGKGADGQALVLVGGVPVWAASGSYDLLSTLTAAEISITGADTATIGRMHVCSGTTADYTVTLPAVTGNAGKFLGLRMSTNLTKIITIDGAGTETIDGYLTTVMWAKETMVLLCDGVGWLIISEKTKPTYAHLKSVTAQLFNAGVATLIAISTAVSEGTPNMGSESGNRIKILRDGKYMIRGAIQYNNTNTNTSLRVFVMIYINGVVFAQAASNCYASTLLSISTTVPASCVATDYIQLYAYYSGGSYSTHTTLTTTEASTVDTSLSVVEL